jgi:hypothetical protein
MPTMSDGTWRMRVADLRPRDRMHIFTEWGEAGFAAFVATNYNLTPGDYYADLLLHMADGGAIPPLKVGRLVGADPEQAVVFDGHHRFEIARMLGWDEVEVVNAGADYPDARPIETAPRGSGLPTP